nr:hypothetical protein HUO10_005290 [Paraburkholderia busanensis]
MLSAIRRTLDLVAQQRGEPFELQDIPPEDPAYVQVNYLSTRYSNTYEMDTA